MRLIAFDFYTAKSGRDEKVREAKISSKILRRKPVNTTRNEYGGVEIYKNLCRQSRRACFALNGHPYLCGCEISDVLKASATSQALVNASSNNNDARNPQGNTDAVERYDTYHLIPISPVRLSSTARAPTQLKPTPQTEAINPVPLPPMPTPTTATAARRRQPSPPQEATSDEANTPEIHHLQKRKKPLGGPKGLFNVFADYAQRWFRANSSAICLAIARVIAPGL